MSEQLSGLPARERLGAAMSAQTCCVTDCAEPATHQAEFVIYAISGTVHPPAIVTLGLYVCPAHATEARAAELLVPEGKRRIEGLLQHLGKARPDWTRSFARWRTL